MAKCVWVCGGVGRGWVVGVGRGGVGSGGEEVVVPASMRPA